MTEAEIFALILDCAYEVHEGFVPGLPAKVYENRLVVELNQQWLTVNRHKEFSVKYLEQTFDHAFKVDLFVENKVIVQIRAGEEITDLDISILKNYVRHSGCKLGILLNFNKHLGKKLVRGKEYYLKK